MGKDDNIKWIDVGTKMTKRTIKEKTKRIWGFLTAMLTL